MRVTDLDQAFEAGEDIGDLIGCPRRAGLISMSDA